VSTIDRIAIRRVAVERATVISGLSFDAVLAKLAAAVGHPDMSAFARDVVAAGTSADLERIVEAATGPAGLMEMAHFDIGEVLRKELGHRAQKAAPRHRRKGAVFGGAPKQPSPEGVWSLPCPPRSRYAGVMPRVKSSQFWRNSANCDSVRDRGVGGSNPLAPTNFSRKHWRFLIDVVGDGRSRSGVNGG
jgi:hypothetical protein